MTPIPDPAESTSLASSSERIFFNLLVILKGVTLAYSATILVTLIRDDMPWSSWPTCGVYLAWLASSLLSALTFVSQALGSARTSIHPTTVVILLTFFLAISEFVTFGLLEPRNGVTPGTQVHHWLLALAVSAALAASFTSIILHQMRSHSYPGVQATNGDIHDVAMDRLGAALFGAASFAVWLVLELIGQEARWWLAGIATVALVPPLAMQQRKIPGVPAS